MSERKPGWYWVKWPHEKKWCVAQYMGRVGERLMWSYGDTIQSDAPREIGPRIPTPDDPWQTVPVEPTPLMSSVAEDHIEAGHDAATIWRAMLMYVPRRESV